MFSVAVLEDEQKLNVLMNAVALTFERLIDRFV
jgi:hypothetical protein